MTATSCGTCDIHDERPRKMKNENIVSYRIIIIKMKVQSLSVSVWQSSAGDDSTCKPQPYRVCWPVYAII